MQPAANLESGPRLVDAPCSVEGCDHRPAALCDYVDRRGNPCGMASCQGHAAAAGGRYFCRRHAGVAVAVIQGRLAAAPLPDLGNRAASLAVFVGDGLGGSISSLLKSRFGATHSVGENPVGLVHRGVDRRRLWEKRWAVYSHVGNLINIAISVDESDPDAVKLIVGLDTVTRVVPAWIAERPATPEAVADARARFAQEMITALTHALDEWAAANAESERRFIG